MAEHEDNRKDFSQRDTAGYKPGSFTVNGKETSDPPIHGTRTLPDYSRTFKPGPGISMQVQSSGQKNVGGRGEMRSVSTLENLEFKEQKNFLFDQLTGAVARKDTLIQLVRGLYHEEGVDQIEKDLTDRIQPLLEQKDGGIFASQEDLESFRRSVEILDKDITEHFNAVKEGEKVTQIRIETITELLPSVKRFVVLDGRFQSILDKKVSVASMQMILSLHSDLSWLANDSLKSIPEGTDEASVTKKLDELGICLTKEETRFAEEDKKAEKENQERDKKEKISRQLRDASLECAHTSEEAKRILTGVTNKALDTALTDAYNEAHTCEQAAQKNQNQATLDDFVAKNTAYRALVEQAKTHLQELEKAPALDVWSGWPTTIQQVHIRANPKSNTKASSTWTKNGAPLSAQEAWGRLHANFISEFEKYVTFFDSGDRARKIREHASLVEDKNLLTTALSDGNVDLAMRLIGVLQNSVAETKNSWDEKLTKETERKKIEGIQRVLKMQYAADDEKAQKIEALSTELYPDEASLKLSPKLQDLRAAIEAKKKVITDAGDNLTQTQVDEYAATTREMEMFLGKENGIRYSASLGERMAEADLSTKLNSYDDSLKKLSDAVNRIERMLPELPEKVSGSGATTAQIDYYKKRLEDLENLRKKTLLAPSAQSFNDFIQRFEEVETEIRQWEDGLIQMATTTREGFKKDGSYGTIKTTTILRSPLLVKAKEGQKISTRDGRTVDLKEYQNEITLQKAYVQLEESERAAKKHEEVLEKYESQFIKDPREFRKIFTYKTWISGDPVKAIVGEILAKDYATKRIPVIQETIARLDDDIVDLTGDLIGEDDPEKKKVIEETLYSIRTKRAACLELIARLSIIEKDPPSEHDLREYHRIYDPDRTRKSVRQVYSPRNDASLAHIAVKGDKMTLREKIRHTIGIGEKRGYAKAQKRDDITSPGIIKALSTDEKNLMSPTPPGAPSSNQGMVRSLTNNEYSDYRSLNENGSLLNVYEAKEGKKLAAVGKLLLTLTQSKTTWKALIRAGIVAFALHPGTLGATTLEASLPKKPTTISDVMKQESWRSSLTVEKKFMSNVMMQGDRYFARFIESQAPSVTIDPNNPSVETAIARLSCIDVLTKENLLGNGREKEQRELGTIIVTLKTILATLQFLSTNRATKTLPETHAASLTFDPKTNTIEKLLLHVRTAIAEADERERVHNL